MGTPPDRMSDIEKLRERQLTCEFTLVTLAENLFELIEEVEEGWSKKLLDKEKNELWLKFRPDSQQYGGGMPMLTRLPERTPPDLIGIILSTRFKDELYAAGRTLLFYERTRGGDFRQELVDKLENFKHYLNKEHIANIVRYTELGSPLNRRNKTGKSQREIAEDAAYFANIATRVQKLTGQDPLRQDVSQYN